MEEFDLLSLFLDSDFLIKFVGAIVGIQLAKEISKKVKEKFEEWKKRR